MDPIQTARVVVAACIEVALPDYVGWVEAGDCLGGVKIEKDIVVPGASVGVEEKDRVGEVVVVLNDVLKVGHGFVPFVGGDGECSIRIVHRVDRIVEA